MEVTLIRHTFDPAMVCGEAAALCTGSDEPLPALRGAMFCGHESVVEHAVFTFRIEGVSRVLLAQLTRHRLASFSVQSQRYCGVNPDSVVIPKSFERFGHVADVDEFLMQAASLYEKLIASGVEEEDARYIIPQGITCSLIMTMNVRELLHFFSLRCCNRAQWEIRELADKMREICYEVSPILFRRSGAACQRGVKCPEGKKSCGKPRK